MLSAAPLPSPLSPEDSPSQGVNCLGSGSDASAGIVDRIALETVSLDQEDTHAQWSDIFSGAPPRLQLHGTRNGADDISLKQCVERNKAQARHTALP
jgi:hypothetical protein